MTDPNAIKNNPFIELGEIPEKKYKEGYIIETAYITVRDGVKIAATICLPKGLPPNAKIPTVLTQTRYWRAMELRIPFRWILDSMVPNAPNPEVVTSRGYALIYTDVRGTGASTGSRTTPFSEEEVKDGYDIVEWIIAQPWSDGNVVSKGISYTGITAEMFARNLHPAIKAVIPGHGFWDPYTDVAFPGGCFDYGFIQMWSFIGKNLDLNNPKVFRQVMPDAWLVVKGVKSVKSDKDLELLNEAITQHKSNQYVYEHTLDKSYRDDQILDGSSFDDFSVFAHKQEIARSNLPILAWCSWLDSGYGDAIIHRFMNTPNPHIAILGDWSHGAILPANQFFPNRTTVTPAPRDKVNAWINFYDKCIYGEGIQGKVIYYYTLVEEKWKKSNVWPPFGHNYQKWYFSDNFTLTQEKPESTVGEDSYKVNFRATTGRNNRWWALLGLPITYENRAKVDEKLICYTSQPLESDTEITGQIILCLYLKSTHDDGSIFAYFEDVDENGKITYITDGEFRVIHRKILTENPPYKILIPYHSYKKEDAAPLVPGEITEIKFGLHSTSVLIKKGHRIKIGIAGADKDTFIRYPAEGRPTITISRNSTYASYLEIPIIKKQQEGEK
ncbi:MAG: CocE/NonD family hydrolase [Candidatus Lokiarchaeota archaeon]|nr:CocE/NonD family hydrolase [Candidatus Lokiarchaeota archaeon]